MRRTGLLIGALLLLIVLVVAVTAQVPEVAGLPTGVRTRLEQYLASPTAPASSAVLVVERARKPWRFGEEQSLSILGDSVYFQTDHPLTWNQGGGPSPVPFPPKELWCALMKGEETATGDLLYLVVYVGLHMDMYNGDWMVHEGPRGTLISELAAELSIVDCRLEGLIHD